MEAEILDATGGADRDFRTFRGSGRGGRLITFVKENNIRLRQKVVAMRWINLISPHSASLFRDRKSAADI